jgi:kumamolisin
VPGSRLGRPTLFHRPITHSNDCFPGTVWAGSLLYDPVTWQGFGKYSLTRELMIAVMTRVRTLAATIGAGVLLLGLVAVFSSQANASGSGSGAGTVTVPQGSNPTGIKGTTETGVTDVETQMYVSFVLRSPEQTQLYALAGSATPTQRYTEAQFAGTFGQSPSVINGLEKYLQGFGIDTYAYSDGLDVSATGTCGEFARALSVTFDNFAFPSARGTQDGYGTKTDPILPTDVGSSILAILGLSSYSPFVSQAVPALGQPAVSSNQVPAGELTPADFTSHYNLTPLLNSGDLGQGQTIGIVTLASFNPEDAYTFWQEYLGLSVSASRITQDDIDGGSGPISLDAGSDETTLDVEQSGAIAPQANIIVYEAPNTDPGFFDAFAAAASQNIAGSVSTSWGEDETLLQEEVNAGVETAAYEAAFDEVFAEMVVQGQADFNASGDFGAYLAQEDGPGSPTNLTVSVSSDSPFVTSAGGTTLPGTQTYALPTESGGTDSGSAQTTLVRSNEVDPGATESVTIPAEQTWGWDYLWPLYQALGLPSEAVAAVNIIGGGGGGYSAIEPRPQYQQGASGVSNFDDREFLTPTGYESTDGLVLPFGFSFNPTPALGTGTQGTGRVLPDLAFNADPQTGYAVYSPTVFGSETPFMQYGGTSFIAPQLNGVTAVYDSAAGKRVGFWNQFIYTAAQSNTSPFTPIDSNTLYGSSYFSATNASGKKIPLAGSFDSSNLFYTGKPGTIYNPGSGLGYANLDGLYTWASILGAKVP